MNVKVLLNFTALFFLLIACKPTVKKENDTDVVARVYDQVLTRDELKTQIPKTNSVLDSLNLAQVYVKNWAIQKMLYRNAMINLDDTEALKNLVEKYKQDLYVTNYKNALVKKRLDTLILNKEIDSFYQANQESFKLKETLLKFRYVHVKPRVRSRVRNKIRTLLKSGLSKDRDDILKNYTEYTDYYFSDSTWVSLKNVYDHKLDFPTLTEKDLHKEKFIQKYGVDKSYYFIFITDILGEGDLAPVGYVDETIKEILLHNNKLKFFNKMEQVLIEDAVKQKEYELY